MHDVNDYFDTFAPSITYDVYGQPELVNTKGTCRARESLPFRRSIRAYVT